MLFSKLQIDHQHGDISGADTGDPGGLSNVQGPDLSKLLPGFQTQTGDGIIVDVLRQQVAFFLLKLLYLLQLALDVSGVFYLYFYLFLNVRRERRALRVKGARPSNSAAGGAPDRPSGRNRSPGQFPVR